MMQLVLSQALNRAEQRRPGVAARIVEWGHARWSAHRARRRYRCTVRALGGLDDRTLHDIGLHRTEIESYASVGGAGRHPSRFVSEATLPRG